MKNLFISTMAAAIVFTISSSSYGKGSPDKIVIFAGRLVSYEVADAETLKKFDPWNGQFIDWAKRALAAPADRSRSCKVFFYMKWPARHSNYDRGDLKLIYAVIYVPGRDGSPGYIHLPGKGEEFFQNNSGTIWRDQEDGKWYQASAAWDGVMNRLMKTGAGQQ